MTDQQRTSGEQHSPMDRAKDTAREMKDRAESTADSMASEARERGREAVDEGKEKAREMGDRAQRKARSRAEEQKHQVAEGIRSVADALRQGTRELPEERQQYGGFLETVADRADDVSGYLEEHDVDEMTREAKRFAREHTATFLGGAFTLGVAGARFLKSSGSRSAREDRPLHGQARSTGVGPADRPTGPAAQPGGVAETRGVNEPYPRESDSRQATERIQEEGGYA